jgi:large subunit ribosomal protein L23
MSILDKVKKSTKKAPAKEAKKTSEKKVTKKVEKPKAEIKAVSKVVLNTIISPIVSEKGAKLADENVMIFKVSKNANRVQVRNAIKELYGVTAVRVNIINVRGKAVTFGRRTGKQSDYKKALVKLPKGTTLNVFEGV